MAGIWWAGFSFATPASSPGIGSISTAQAASTPTPGKTPTAQPGVSVSDPAYWDTLLGTRCGVNAVESVNQGHDSWKQNPVSVANALVTTLPGWKHPLSASLLSGGGTEDIDATVQVQEVLTRQGPRITGPVIIVTLSRLEGKTCNIWMVIGAQGKNTLTLTNLQPGSLISSPVTLKGSGNAFEGTIGVAFVLDHLSQVVGQRVITSSSGTGMRYLPYSVQVSYQLSYQQGVQESIVEIRQPSPSGEGTAILLKVLLSPKDHFVFS